MTNNIDMGGFGSPGLPARSGLNGAVIADVAPYATILQDWRSGAQSVLSVGASGVVNMRNGTPATTDPGIYWGTNGHKLFGATNILAYGWGGTTYVGFSPSALSLKSDYTLAWSSGSADTNSLWDVRLNRDTAATLAQRNGTTAQEDRLYRSYTDGSNYSRLSRRFNTTTALIHAEGAGTGSDGSVAFNDAALATNATVGFLMIPSCAGTPSGTPADIPTGQIPLVWDSTNLKLYAYTGGAWKASAAFT